MNQVKVTSTDAKSECWRRGRLKYKLYESQILMSESLSKSTGQLFVANVHRQMGKSYWAVTKAIELALSKPKARIKYGTAFQTDLVEFIIPTFESVLEDCPTEFRPKFKVQGSKFVFKNGSEIKLIGCDKNPDGLRGNVIDMIILDEAGFIDRLDYLFSSIIVPATLHRAHCKIILISTPPVSPAHDFKTYAQRAEAEGSYVKIDILSNPRLTQADIERMAKPLGGKESVTFRREFLCEFATDAERQLIPEWNDIYVKDTPKDQYYNYFHKYVGMDLGTKDFTAVIFGYYDWKRATLVIEDEFVLSGPTLTTLLLKDTIVATEKRLWPNQPPYRRISDNNNLHLLQDLQIMHGISFIPTGKDTLEAMLNEVREMVAKGQIEVNPRCKQTIGCLKYGIWDSKRKKFDRSQIYGHFDCLAALVYLTRNLNKHTNPIPHDFGFDPRNARIKTHNQNFDWTKSIFPAFLTKKPTY